MERKRAFLDEYLRSLMEDMTCCKPIRPISASRIPREPTNPPEVFSSHSRVLSGGVLQILVPTSTLPNPDW